MRRLTRATCVVVLLGAATLGAAPPDAPPRPVIELPPGPPPAPLPKPAPGARVKLGAGQVYDVRAQVSCVVRAYPAGLVAVAKEEVAAGETLRVRDTFSDGATTRTYKGPLTVYSVRAVGTGACELVVTPLGLKSEAEIVTVAFDVDAGQGPQPPPPKPIDPPQPKPVDPPAPIPAAGLHVLVVYESADLSKYPSGQQAAIYAKSVRDYLNATCPAGPDGKTRQWRMWDKDTDATEEQKLWQDALKRARTQTPWVIVSNGTTGFEGPLPASADEMLALLKRYGGK